MLGEIHKPYVELTEKWKALFVDLDQHAEEMLRWSASEKQWSINQILVHLMTTELGTIRYLKKKMQSKEPFRSSNYWSNTRYILLKWALKSAIKFKMPKILAEPSTTMSYVEIKKNVVFVHAEMEEFLAEFPERLFDKQIFKHPLAGRLPLVQSLWMLNHHFEHHMHQLNRIAAQYELHH